MRLPIPTAVAILIATLTLPAVAADDQVFGRILSTYVDDDGWVDYAGLASDDQAKSALIAYLDTVRKTDLDSLEGDAKLAHLINAYNAFTLHLILDSYDNGKLESIMELHDGKPFDQKIFNLGGQQVSLDQIENELIRPNFDEPRIHWALVCAAYSCPPLRNEPYTAAKLDEQLAEQEKYVLNLDHPRYIQRKNGELSVTPLFDWYGQDFNGGKWQAYVLQRIDATENEFGAFLDYDWKLNSQANKPE